MIRRGFHGKARIVAVDVQYEDGTVETFNLPDGGFLGWMRNSFKGKRQNEEWMEYEVRWRLPLLGDQSSSSGSPLLASEVSSTTQQAIELPDGSADYSGTHETTVEPPVLEVGTESVWYTNLANPWERDAVVLKARRAFDISGLVQVLEDKNTGERIHVNGGGIVEG